MNAIAITGTGSARRIEVGWALDKTVPWLDLRVFWYLAKVDAQVRNRRMPSYHYTFGVRTVANHRITAPDLHGRLILNLTIPDHPASGMIGSGCVHWAAELVAAPKNVVAREHFHHGGNVED